MESQQLDSQQTFSRLLEYLEYKSSPNFVSEETFSQDIPAELGVTWREAKDKLKVDAIYFVADAPVIYFKRFEIFDREEIAELHRNVWSQSKIPLLFVILPNDIRVYSGYEAPKRDKSRTVLLEPSRLENKLIIPDKRPVTELWERLKIFTRAAIESGSFWREYSDSKYFKRKTRADQKLLVNLRYIRCELVKDLSQKLKKKYNPVNDSDQKLIKESSSRYANSLIGRSIFALYLQDRGVLQTGKDGFFAQRYGANYHTYTDLLTSYEYTFDFFKFLHDRFNGDMFPSDMEEKEVIDEDHLQKLRMLFTVDMVSGGQMLFFWAYNFEFIPIELISSIYEEFLHVEENGKDGTYYTPPRLVDFMLDQLLPESDDLHNTFSILDPACGSGIFLVEAYRRLVEHWIKIHKEKPSFIELSKILKGSIFGIDIKREALHVAAFSLYLAMLDYLEPKAIWMYVQFPSLIKEGNLIEADFFDKRVSFGDIKFDLVLGNPPWESQLTSYARIFLDEHGYDVGDEQIAQAFLWHAPDFCAPQGQIALLCSSKSLLFNRSGPNISFRRKFFRQFTITKIFDFSALRRFLFEKAIAPTTAIFYMPQIPTPSATIFYGAPKLTHLTRRFAALVIEANDLKYLPLEQILKSIDNMESASQKNKEVDNESIAAEQEELFPSEEKEETSNNGAINIWKVALWGTDYDYILLQQLNKFPLLREIIIERKWISKVGFNRKGPNEGNLAEWLDDKPYLAPENFTRYSINIRELKPLPKRDHYYRRGIAEQFRAPLVLFKRTQVHRQLGAAYLDQDIAYSETFTCIAGTEQDSSLLKAVTALLNSDLAQYYLFLTSASWGIEREEIKAGEMKTIPFPFYETSSEQIVTIANLVDDMAKYAITSPSMKKQIEHELNKQIYACFHLSEQEIQHIRETIEYTINFFHRPETSTALEEPTVEMKKSYAKYYMKSLNFLLEPVDRRLTSVVYVKEATPLLTIKFSLSMPDEAIADIQEEEPDDDMRQVLSRLDKLSIERVFGGMYHRRNFQMYGSDDEDILYVVKPSERRFWTIGAALSDAQEMVAELT